MNEIEMKIEPQDIKGKDKGIEILVTNQYRDNMLYKFLYGKDGVWTTLKDFSKDKSFLWNPEEDGEYDIMVKGRQEKSTKSFDYVSRMVYQVEGVGDNHEKTEDENLITDVSLDKDSYLVGERINLKVHSYVSDLMYRYWIKSENGWELIKDYSGDNTISYRIKCCEKDSILVECKRKESQEKVDDFRTVSFKVDSIPKVEICEFKCLDSKCPVVGNEINFKVSVKGIIKENILYKFCKIDKNGNMECIREFSTNPTISYVEESAGEYRMLCIVKDMYSVNEYDDRAILNYEVKAYEDVNIISFTSDMSSPQMIGREIRFEVSASGGKDLRYRFLIKGIKELDTGYTRDNFLIYKFQEHGEYQVICMVKDDSCKDDYEAEDVLKYTIIKEMYIPIKIKNVVIDKVRRCIIGEEVNVMVKTDGGEVPMFEFKVFNGENQVFSSEYTKSNWFKFTPDEKGDYRIRIRVKDIGSFKEFDCESEIFLNVKEFIPGALDYVLMNSKEYYRIGDNIPIEVIAENTASTYVKYILKINGRIVESTKYTMNKKYMFTPKVSGCYSIDILAKNKKSKEEYDNKKTVKVMVHDTLPITDVSIEAEDEDIYVNEAVTFTAKSFGGRDVIYEFYLMEHNEWRKIQGYSKKSFYTFIPFGSGSYKILVFAKSFMSQISYEDYCLYEFEVYEREENKYIV